MGALAPVQGFQAVGQAVSESDSRIWTSIADKLRFWTENADMFSATELPWTYGSYTVRPE